MNQQDEDTTEMAKEMASTTQVAPMKAAKKMVRMAASPEMIVGLRMIMTEEVATEMERMDIIRAHTMIRAGLPIRDNARVPMMVLDAMIMIDQKEDMTTTVPKEEVNRMTGTGIAIRNVTMRYEEERSDRRDDDRMRRDDDRNYSGQRRDDNRHRSSNDRGRNDNDRGYSGSNQYRDDRNINEKRRFEDRWSPGIDYDRGRREGYTTTMRIEDT